MIKDFSTYNNRKKSKWKNDGFRTLYESVIPNEVLLTLDDWKRNNNSDYVLIGGLALSYYIKPRYTEDVDLIFLTKNDIPLSVNKFKRNRPSAFNHIKTGVEVELLTPGHINQTTTLFKNIFQTAIESDGIKIASPLGLIALKLFRSKTKEQDRIDIINLCRYCYENDIELDLTLFELSKEELDIFEEIKGGIDFEMISENMYMLETNMYFNENVDHKRICLEDCEIVLFKEEYGEPRFHFGKNINNKIRKYSDFQFSISLTKPFENNKLRVLESSTEYKSFNGFEKKEEILKKWLEENIDFLKEEWQKLNKRKITF
jgi:hypothetical protein